MTLKSAAMPFVLFVTCLLSSTAEAQQGLRFRLVWGPSYRQEEFFRTDSALRRAAEVMNGGRFRERVLNFEHDGIPAFVDNNGLSNQEILEAIYRAEEVGYAGETGVGEIHHDVIDIAFCTWRSAIGFTSPGTEWITTYRCKYNRLSDASLAGHLVHEWLHKLGFGHDFRRTPTRPYSVPYAIGSIVEELLR